MEPEKFFAYPKNTLQKQYEALREFFLEGTSGEDTAKKFGYTLSSFYSLSRDFKIGLKEGNMAEQFFTIKYKGRKPKDSSGEINKFIIDLRKKYLSVTDIKAVLDVQGETISESYIYNVINKDGFARLPRRNQSTRRQAASSLKLKAPKSYMLDFKSESFAGNNSLGVLNLLPYIRSFGIDRLIKTSLYPETNSICKLSSILSFVALKLSNVKRYSYDDAWCMDRGLGLFAGLNILPKSGWYTSYSDRITQNMNRNFLKGLHRIFSKAGLLSDTANIDFTAIPYWGDDSHLENNWSGKRNKAMASMLAVLAQDPDSGIITYGDTNVRHHQSSKTVIEFLDFYQSSENSDLKYLVFDSKFTTYQNLAKLDNKIKFLTIRRRGKKIVEELNNKPPSLWKKVRVPMANGQGRNLKVIDENIFLKDYGKEVRQIAITGHGKIKPALLITNDFEKPCAEIIRKYTRRWLVEKSISEQIEFFHLNKVSSSMVIKVDFDLTMSILAHNLIRLYALDLPGYAHIADYTFYNKFLSMSGSVDIADDEVIVKFKKKRNLPAILTAMEQFKEMKIGFIGKRKLVFSGATTS
ncbi:MAG: transposase [Planctomycetia bacterium]|nr:transposase [Planctomycetia bacterium]